MFFDLTVFTLKQYRNDNLNFFVSIPMKTKKDKLLRKILKENQLLANSLSASDYDFKNLIEKMKLRFNEKLNQQKMKVNASKEKIKKLEKMNLRKGDEIKIFKNEQSEPQKILLGGLIGTASAEKDGLMGKEYTIRYIYNAGLSISYYANGISFYSTTSLIELFLYSTGSVAYYRILATPKKNIIIRYLGDNDCDFKLNGNILYVLPRHTDITIKYKIGLYRNDIPDFATISISDFANITGNIITPTAG